MTDDIKKKIDENANNAGWNILCLIVGGILIFATSGIFKIAGWIFAAIGVFGFFANYVIDQRLEQKVEEKERAATMKQCPACAEDIKIEAKKCKHCGEILA